MSREKRKELLKKLESKRGTKVIAYVTSDRQGLQASIQHDIVSIVHEHILSLPDKKRGKIDLFIYSRGGSADVPWALVSMFREYCQKGSFSVLIPFRAHSAATVISLGADEIIMTKKGELGPIDATMSGGPYNPREGGSSNSLPVSVEDVTGYFALLDRFGCERPDEKMRGFQQLTEKVHPLALGAVSRLLEETKLVGLRLLSTRAKPFKEEENHEIIRKLSSEVYSHNHAISRTEARKHLGLKQVKNSEDAAIDSELWELYTEYRSLFDLENPFQPEAHLIANNLEEHAWNGLNLASVESVNRLDICKRSQRVRRLRNVPPTVNLNVSDIHFPGVNFGPVPAGVTPEQVNAMVKQAVQGIMQPILNHAVQQAVDVMIKSLPQKGFEIVAYNAGWTTES